MKTKQFQKLLRQNRVKLTGPRQAIYSILNQAERSLSAYELHDLAQKQYAGLNLVTVYRTLELFGRLGLIETHLHADRSCPTYRLQSKQDQHHLVCRVCGLVYPFDHRQVISQMAEDLAEQSGYLIEGHIIEFTGLCPVCQAKLQALTKQD